MANLSVLNIKSRSRKTCSLIFLILFGLSIISCDVIEITPTVVANTTLICPTLDLAINSIPSEIFIGDTIFLATNISSKVDFFWGATLGELSDPESQSPDYLATDAGKVIITVTLTDTCEKTETAQLEFEVVRPPTNTPTVTATYTSTPIPTSTQTNTPSSTPSYTPTLTPTNTDTPIPPQILPTATPFQVLRIIQPEGGRCYNTAQIRFEWEYYRPLKTEGPLPGEPETFAVRLGTFDNGEPHSIVWTKDNFYILDVYHFDPPLQSETIYAWNIAVIEPFANPPHENWQLIEKSSTETFIFGCGGNPPTLTPTPKSSTPTPVSCPPNC